MSDGPYRSLPMRKGWRDVSECAHKDVYTAEERADRMCAALHLDFQRDVGRDFLNSVGNILINQAQQNLLASQATFELEAIRERYNSTGLRDAVVEHIQVALHQGHVAEAALAEGVDRAMLDHAHSCIRSVEEHYIRDALNKNERQKTISVRDNLHQTLTSQRVQGFGGEIVDLIQGKAVVVKTQKAVGLDVGPVVK